MFFYKINKDKLIRFLILIFFALFVYGCIAKTDKYDVLSVWLPDNYKYNYLSFDESIHNNTDIDDNKHPFSLGESLSEWWRILNSSELNDIIDRGLANNSDMRIATLRIAQTQERLFVSKSGKLPEISLPARIEAKSPEFGLGTVPSNGKTNSVTTYEISLRSDWRPDIWGEQASLEDSALFQLWRSTFQRDEVQRNLVTSIVSNYLEYLSLNDRIRVARETETVLNEMLESLLKRLDLGDSTITEIEQQKTAVFSVSATIPVLEQQRLNIINRLSNLVGSVPGNLILLDNGVDSIVFPSVFPGIPSSFLLHRPDIKMVEAKLLSASADIDVARTRILPPIDLTAQLGYGSKHLSEIIQPQSLMWSAIANISATIFDNGKRSGEIKFAKNVQEEMVETYIRVIYDALREVEDAMNVIKFTRDRLEEQRIATDASRLAWDYSRDSYLAGAVDYFIVLDSQRTYHKNLDEWYKVIMERNRGLVSLFSSLGGGVPRGVAIPGEGMRPCPLTSKIDLTLTKDMQYGAVITDRVEKKEERNGVRHVQQDPYLSGQTLFTDQNMSSSLQDWEIAQPNRELVVPIIWTNKKFHQNEWLIEILGVYEHNSVDPAWRDLCTRFPKQTEKLFLVRHRQGLVEGRNEERASWYRLFLSKFSSFDEAEELCSLLRNNQIRCQPVLSSESDILRH